MPSDQANEGPDTRNDRQPAPAGPRPGARSLIIYTGLRLAVFLVVWLLLQWLTGMRGLLALALAIVVSGAISLLLLNRQRDAMSAGVWRFFRRINERIDAATRAEDDDDRGDNGGEGAIADRAVPGASSPSSPSSSSSPSNAEDRGKGKGRGQGKAVGKDE